MLVFLFLSFSHSGYSLFYSQLLIDWVFTGVWLIKHLFVSSCLVVRRFHRCKFRGDLHQIKHILDYGVLV